MFENIRRMFRGETPEPPKAQSQDLGLKVETESDGIRLKKVAGDLRTGDRLLLSFTLDGESWERRIVAFQEERGGMFVYTGSKPVSVAVIREDDVIEKKDFKSVQRSVYQSRRVSSDERWSSDYCASDDFFNCCHPLSPFYGHNFNNPLGLYSVFSYMNDSRRDDSPSQPASPSVLEQLRAPEPDTGGHRHFDPAPATAPSDTNGPGTNPFDPRGIQLEAPLPESGTNTVHGAFNSSTNSFGDLEAKDDGKGLSAPLEAEAPVSAGSPSNTDSPSFGSEPNAYH